MPTLESSAISRVAYNAARRCLYVTYRDTGEVYAYVGVPRSVYDALLKADSAGRFVNARIKPHYKAQHLSEP